MLTTIFQFLMQRKHVKASNSRKRLNIIDNEGENDDEMSLVTLHQSNFIIGMRYSQQEEVPGVRPVSEPGGLLGGFYKIYSRIFNAHLRFSSLPKCS